MLKAVHTVGIADIQDVLRNSYIPFISSIAMEVSQAFLTQTYKCLEGCAFCCLCEPEVPNEELSFFLSDEKLKSAVQKKFADGEHKYVLKLRNGHGACIFLENKRCKIYEKRPLYCRLYPFQRHLSTRLQITANLSCRGLWLGEGEKVSEIAERLAGAMKGFGRVFGMLRERYRNAMERMEEAYISQQEVQNLVLEILPNFTTKEGLEKILSFADQNEMRFAEASEICNTEPCVDAEEYAEQVSIEVFKERDVLNLPVYSTPSLEWFVLKFENGKLNWYSMNEEGELEFVRYARNEGGLKELDEEARELLQDYVKLLNARDITYGNALLLTDFSKNEIPVISNYLGALATSVLELWWRANLFAEQKITANALKEGIIFYDADYLDKPTLGAIL